MDKKVDVVRRLTNVKIVLGNGFDLHCNLHTTYSDYYCKHYRKYLFIQNLYKEFANKDILNFDFNETKIKNINVWDIFFALNSSNNPKECKRKWCDIEQLMLSSFQRNQQQYDKEKAVLLIGSKIHWKTINDCISNGAVATNHTDMFVEKYAKDKMSFLGIYPSCFYQFLLDELKAFEKNFGEFIYWQLHNKYLEKINYNQNQFINAGYVERALDTINQLCGDIHNLVEIDSFNYSYIHNTGINRLISYINGSYKSPIFGIDTVFEPGDERFIFTKTGRRIDSDMYNDEYDNKNDFDNAIVYGHSLNESDYCYFFPLFDKLNLANTLAKGKIVFCYSIYDNKRTEDIKNELRERVFKILFEYARSKGLSDPKRFLDGLSVQNRIILYEVPLLNKKDYTVSGIDDEWDEIYREVDLAYKNNE